MFMFMLIICMCVHTTYVSIYYMLCYTNCFRGILDRLRIITALMHMYSLTVGQYRKGREDHNPLYSIYLHSSHHHYYHYQHLAHIAMAAPYKYLIIIFSPLFCLHRFVLFNNSGHPLSTHGHFLKNCSVTSQFAGSDGSPHTNKLHVSDALSQNPITS